LRGGFLAPFFYIFESFLTKEETMSESAQDAKELVAQAELDLINEDWESALTHYEAALPLLGDAPDSELAEVFNGQGVAFLKLDRIEEAITALSKALQYTPAMAGAYYNLALCYQNIENFEQALQNYDRAIELEPQDAEVYFRRGGVYFMLEKYEQTIADNTRVIELHPAGAVTGPYIGRGLAYYQLERYEEASHDFSQAIESDPRAASEAFFYRALVFIQLDQPLPARNDLQAFLLMTDEPDGSLGVQAREIIEALDE
jgi:tetratricopeptide (TPR) repeat protein